MVMVAGAELGGVPDRDATLDAFITPDAETDDVDDGLDENQDAENDEAENQVAESVERPVADDSSGDEREAGRVTERAETTFAWSQKAVACDGCGGQTRRRWRTDAGFVCPDCVDWERAPEH